MRIITKGATSKSIYVVILDSASTTGGRKTGIVFNSAGMTAYYTLNGAAAVAITLATLAASSSAYSSGGFKEVDATNQPGLYRLDVPNAALTGADSVVITIKGASGAVQVDEEIQLSGLDIMDAVRAGLTALANASAGASGGLLISGSNAGTTTLGALTVTGATTLTGNMVLSDGLTISAPSTLNRAGLDIAGNGTGAGLKSTGGATGAGISAIGGGTSGDAILTAATSGHGITAAGTGTTKHGINATGGATTSHGIVATGGGVGHGILATSGAGATGNGIQATAASTNGSGMTLVKTGSGSDLNATVTPLVLAKTTNITGLNDIAATAVVSSGAITTSGGAVTTVTTATNLTNAPTAGDLTATMKTSVTTAATAATPTAAAVTAAVTLSAGDSPVLQSGTATAGGASTITIQTALGADSLPVGCIIKITSGTGAKQARTIITYVNATLVATVDRAWTVAPDATSVYSIIYLEAAALSAGLKITGLVLADTLTTLTGHTPQTGDSFARIGAAGAGLTNIDLPNQTMDIVGTITTVTNVTNGVTVTTNNDKTGYRLSATGIGDVLTTALTEAYAADGAAPTLSQLLFLLQSVLTEFSISGTTITAKKIDGVTTSSTHTLDSSTSPTSRTRAT